MNKSFATASKATILATLIFAGCRTYGGYDSAALSDERVRAIAVEFADDAETAAKDFQRLSGATHLDAGLVAKFGAVVDEHRGAAAPETAALAASDRLTYRAASRKLGAIVSMRRDYNDRYQSVLRAMTATADRPSGPLAQDRPARYQAVPASYFRSNGDVVTVDDVVRADGN